MSDRRLKETTNIMESDDVIPVVQSDRVNLSEEEEDNGVHIKIWFEVEVD